MKRIECLFIPMMILMVMLGFEALALANEIENINEKIEEIENIKCERTVEEKEIEEEVSYDKLDTVGKLHYKAELNGLDPYLVEAISRVETGHFNSNAFLNHNNFGGLTGSQGVMSFDTYEEGLDAYIKTLVWYKSDGLETVEEIAGRYCPVNKDNWIVMVNSVYKEIKEGKYL